MSTVATGHCGGRPLLSSQRSAWLLALWIAVAIFAISPNFRPASGPQAPPFAGDFLQEWMGGYVVRCGDYARFYELAYVQTLQHDETLTGFQWRRSEYFPLVYPPFYYLLVSPLSWLPFHAAAVVWAALMVGAYFAAWATFAKCLPETRTAPASVCWLLPASLLYMPLIESLTTCQKGTLLLLILASTFYLLRTGRPYLAGLVFGLIAFKPHLALPIALAMLCKTQWRFVLGGLTSGGLLAALCLAMGVDVCRQYVEFSTQAGDYLQSAGYDLNKSHAWHGFFALLLGVDHPGTKFFTILAAGMTVAIVALALRGRLEPASPRFGWQFSALVIATVLLSPHLYTYDLTILLLPLGLVAVGRMEGTRVLPPGLPWLALLLFSLAGLSPQVAAMTSVQLTVPLLLALLWANKKAADRDAGG